MPKGEDVAELKADAQAKIEQQKNCLESQSGSILQGMSRDNFLSALPDQVLACKEDVDQANDKGLVGLAYQDCMDGLELTLKLASNVQNALGTLNQSPNPGPGDILTFPNATPGTFDVEKNGSTVTVQYPNYTGATLLKMANGSAAPGDTLEEKTRAVIAEIFERNVRIYIAGTDQLSRDFPDAPYRGKRIRGLYQGYRPELFLDDGDKVFEGGYQRSWGSCTQGVANPGNRWFRFANGKISGERIDGGKLFNHRCDPAQAISEDANYALGRGTIVHSLMMVMEQMKKDLLAGKIIAASAYGAPDRCVRQRVNIDEYRKKLALLFNEVQDGLGSNADKLPLECNLRDGKASGLGEGLQDRICFISSMQTEIELNMIPRYAHCTYRSITDELMEQLMRALMVVSRDDFPGSATAPVHASVDWIAFLLPFFLLFANPRSAHAGFLVDGTCGGGWKTKGALRKDKRFYQVQWVSRNPEGSPGNGLVGTAESRYPGSSGVTFHQARRVDRELKRLTDKDAGSFKPICEARCEAPRQQFETCKKTVNDQISKLKSLKNPALQSVIDEANLVLVEAEQAYKSALDLCTNTAFPAVNKNNRFGRYFNALIGDIVCRCNSVKIDCDFGGSNNPIVNFEMNIPTQETLAHGTGANTVAGDTPEGITQADSVTYRRGPTPLRASAIADESGSLNSDSSLTQEALGGGLAEAGLTRTKNGQVRSGGTSTGLSSFFGSDGPGGSAGPGDGSADQPTSEPSSPGISGTGYSSRSNRAGKPGSGNPPGSRGRFMSASLVGKSGSSAVELESGTDSESINPMGSADPADYFTRIDLTDDLFKKVERKYRQKSQDWVLDSLK